jgi:hypothetical protein
MNADLGTFGVWSDLCHPRGRILADGYVPLTQRAAS